jgi:3-methylcrotonyl-CoA carboxylase alpha subunit
MAKLTLQPQGAAAPLTVEIMWGKSDGKSDGFTLTAEQGTLQAEGRADASGAGTLRIGARVLPFYFSRADNELHLWLDGETYVFTLPRVEQAGRRHAGALSASGEVVSPMPGVVLKVLVQPGETVAAQAPLVVVESMKMELTVPAPADGKVAEILCEPGDRVDRGAVLVRMEGQQEGPPQ